MTYDFENLKGKQVDVYNYVANNIKNQKQFFLIVTAKAGYGKSYTLCALKKVFKDKISPFARIVKHSLNK